VTAVEKTSGGTTLESVTYTYDALDNRIGMDENGAQTWTLYDSGNPIMDFNSSGSLTMRYLWGPTGIVARETSGGTVSWYLADHLGTVRDLINNSGAIIDHVDFSAFGTVLDESSPTSGDRMMGFAMLERDTVTGLNLAVYREENPRTGRWDSQDPMRFAAGDADLYRYVKNAPSNSADPSGRGGREGLIAGGTAAAVGATIGWFAGGPPGAAAGGVLGGIIGFGWGYFFVDDVPTAIAGGVVIGVVCGYYGGALAGELYEAWLANRARQLALEEAEAAYESWLDTMVEDSWIIE
jgi:RHS repeat-associated protein